MIKLFGLVGCLYVSASTSVLAQDGQERPSMLLDAYQIAELLKASPDSVHTALDIGNRRGSTIYCGGVQSDGKWFRLSYTDQNADPSNDLAPDGVIGSGDRLELTINNIGEKDYAFFSDKDLDGFYKPSDGDSQHEVVKVYLGEKTNWSNPGVRIAVDSKYRALLPTVLKGLQDKELQNRQKRGRK